MPDDQDDRNHRVHQGKLKPIFGEREGGETPGEQLEIKIRDGHEEKQHPRNQGGKQGNYDWSKRDKFGLLGKEDIGESGEDGLQPGGKAVDAHENSDRLSAAETGKDRPTMADRRRQTRCPIKDFGSADRGMPNLNSPTHKGLERRKQAKRPDQEDRGQNLEHVERNHEEPEFPPEGSRDVGSSGILAADFPGILVKEDLAD